MKNRFLIVCAVLALLTVPPAPAAPKQPSVGGLDSASLDRFSRDQMTRQGLVGLSLVVMQDGKVTATKCYGMASRQTRQPVTPNTEFAIGSITKQFTAACVLLLAEDGRLSVHDPVSKYYPALTRASEITLLDLLNHVSGYADDAPMDFFDPRWAKPTTLDAVIGEYAGKPLDFDPGTRWSYSNTGYLILGRIVERVSRQPLNAFMQARLFAPLGMVHTHSHPPVGALTAAQGYTRFALSGPMEAPREADGWIGGDGVLYSTPSDLAKWDLALMSGRVLKPRSLAVMTTPCVLKNGTPTQYGAGLFVGARQGRTVWVHTGGVSGFAAENWMLPVRRSAIIVALNTDYGDLSALVRPVGLALLDAAPVSAPAPPPPVIGAASAAPPSPVPAVRGPAAETVVRRVVAVLEQGTVDRATLGVDYSAFLTPALLRVGAHSLRGWGTPRAIQTESIRSRGGMEVSEFSLAFGKGTLSATLFRTPDGKVQEFLISPASK